MVTQIHDGLIPVEDYGHWYYIIEPSLFDLSLPKSEGALDYLDNIAGTSALFDNQENAYEIFTSPI